MFPSDDSTIVRYFAYGSNMWTEQFVQRTQVQFNDTYLPRIAFLPSYQFGFTMADDDGRHYANIIRINKHVNDALDANRSDQAVESRIGFEWIDECRQQATGVYGVLYTCPFVALRRLDAFESGYELRAIEVYDETQAAIDAYTYMATSSHVGPAAIPHPSYIERILKGARDHRLPADYIEHLARLGYQLQ